MLIAQTPGGSSQQLGGNILFDSAPSGPLSGAVNNFDPGTASPQGAVATLVKLQLLAATTISGMVAPTGFAPVMRWLQNDTAQTLTIPDMSGLSDATARFQCGGAPVTVGPGLAIQFLYNSRTRVWDMLAVSQATPAAPPVGANPTASIGLAVVNGVAATFMRSDAAPPLDQSIAPTWTGAHIFTNASPIRVQSAAPRILLSQTGAAADAGLWDENVTAGVYSIRTRTDADGAGRNVLAATRGAGVAISSIAVGDAVSNPTVSILGTGLFSVGGGATITGAVSAGNVNVTAATVPAVGIYLVGANRLAFSTATTRRGEFDASGNFVTLVQNFAADGTNAAPAYAFSSDATKGIYSSASGAIGIAIAGANVVEVAANRLQVNGTAPQFLLDETDEGTDGKIWRAVSTGGSFQIATRTDANGAGTNALNFTRTGLAITSMIFGNATDNNTYRFQGTGSIRFDGTSTGAQTATFVATNKPGAGTAAPIAWISVLTAAGTQGWVPVWGN